jgi:hypothetical protein
LTNEADAKKVVKLHKSELDGRWLIIDHSTGAVNDSKGYRCGGAEKCFFSFAMYAQ